MSSYKMSREQVRRLISPLLNECDNVDRLFVKKVAERKAELDKFLYGLISNQRYSTMFHGIVEEYKEVEDHLLELRKCLDHIKKINTYLKLVPTYESEVVLDDYDMEVISKLKDMYKQVGK